MKKSCAIFAPKNIFWAINLRMMKTFDRKSPIATKFLAIAPEELPNATFAFKAMVIASWHHEFMCNVLH